MDSPLFRLASTASTKIPFSMRTLYVSLWTHHCSDCHPLRYHSLWGHCMCLYGLTIVLLVIHYIHKDTILYEDTVRLVHISMDSPLFWLSSTTSTKIPFSMRTLMMDDWSAAAAWCKAVCLWPSISWTVAPANSWLEGKWNYANTIQMICKRSFIWFWIQNKWWATFKVEGTWKQVNQSDEKSH